MIVFKIEELLQKKKKSKYWLCQNMEDFCRFLDCSIDDLIDIKKDA